MPTPLSSPTVPLSPTATPTRPTRAAGANVGANAGSATATRLTAMLREHSPAGAADAVWVPLATGVLVLAAGAMSLATGKPWLFAGLGPTALLVAASPGHPTTKFHTVVVGHALAIAAGWLALLLLGAGDAPTILTGKALTVGRVWASAIAVSLFAVVAPSLRAWHPPAAATALLVTVGVYRMSWRTSLALMGGVVVVALLGEWFQRTRLAQRDAAQHAA